MKPQPWERLYAAKLSATPGYIELEIPNAMDIHSDRIRRDPISVETALRLYGELKDILLIHFNEDLS